MPQPPEPTNVVSLPGIAGARRNGQPKALAADPEHRRRSLIRRRTSRRRRRRRSREARIGNS